VNSKRLLRAVLVLFVIVLTLAFFQSNTRGDIRAVVLHGQPAPGLTGGRFLGFSGASVNASGDMAFGASVDVGGVQSEGIFAVLTGVLTPVALQGQLLPDGSGRYFSGAFGPPQINDNGAIVFPGNFTGIYGSNTRGIFEYSGGTLRNVVDQSTPVPGMPGATFSLGPDTQVLINNSGEIAFFSYFLPAPISSFNIRVGIFTVSQGVVGTIFTTYGARFPFSLNNNGDIAFVGPNGMSVYSGGTITQPVTVGQTVPNSSLVVLTTPVPAINDAKDLVFRTYGTGCCNGQGGMTVVPNGIVRWRGGALEKIVAAGDPVPGFPGAVFDTTFGQPVANVSGIAFTGSTVASNSQPATALVGEIRNGQLIVAAKQNDLIPGVGALRSISPDSTKFDDQQGPVVTFLSETSLGPGLFAATPASNDLQIPQIANGTAAGGGWVTTILLANQSSSASSATVKFYDGNGAAMNVFINGQQVTQVSLSVPALGVAQLQTDGTGPLVSGWADVQSDQPLSGTALFGFLSSSGGLVSQVGAPAGTPLRAFAVFAQSGAGMSTGVALANPNPAAASVTLTLVDSNSSSVATASVSIPPNGHMAKYIGEMFPSIASGNFQGKLNIASTQPLIGLTLLQQGSLFTSLPIIP
jgi:hypothetical protein